jgi:hypothetical protein
LDLGRVGAGLDEVQASFRKNHRQKLRESDNDHDDQDLGEECLGCSSSNSTRFHCGIESFENFNSQDSNFEESVVSAAGSWSESCHKRRNLFLFVIELSGGNQLAVVLCQEMLSFE